MQYPEYVVPSSWDEAVQLLRNNKNAKLLAGGTDLLVALNEGKLSSNYLIDLRQSSSSYHDIVPHNGELQIGALTIVENIARSELVREKAPVLAQAAGLLGSWQIRNMATIGGNICNASPAADLAPALLVLEAMAEIQDKDGIRQVPLIDFFTGPGSTVLGKSGILRRVKIPFRPSGAHSQYLKLTIRKSMDLPLVGVAVLLQVDAGVCKDVRIALGAVAPTPMRARKAEATLLGKRLTEELIIKASEVAAGECSPLSDIRASADYRREMIKVYSHRALFFSSGL